jgi:hypothetical protein
MHQSTYKCKVMENSNNIIVMQTKYCAVIMLQSTSQESDNTSTKNPITAGSKIASPLVLQHVGLGSAMMGGASPPDPKPAVLAVKKNNYNKSAELLLPRAVPPAHHRGPCARRCSSPSHAPLLPHGPMSHAAAPTAPRRAPPLP